MGRSAAAAHRGSVDMPRVRRPGHIDADGRRQNARSSSLSPQARTPRRWSAISRGCGPARKEIRGRMRGRTQIQSAIAKRLSFRTARGRRLIEARGGARVRRDGVVWSTRKAAKKVARAGNDDPIAEVPNGVSSLAPRPLIYSSHPYRYVAHRRSGSATPWHCSIPSGARAPGFAAFSASSFWQSRPCSSVSGIAREFSH